MIGEADERIISARRDVEGAVPYGIGALNVVGADDLGRPSD